jgi:hypothetical protein
LRLAEEAKDAEAATFLKNNQEKIDGLADKEQSLADKRAELNAAKAQFELYAGD